MRVLVTGSRTWDDTRTLRWALDTTLALALRTDGKLILVHGDARSGADHLADEWGREQERSGAPVVVERHPAKWRKWDGAKDPQAGFRRNAAMVDLGADLCLAFVARCPCPDASRNGPSGMHGTHGAVDCLNRARAAGIHVKPFRPGS